jgi:hypothetical protein
MQTSLASTLETQSWGERSIDHTLYMTLVTQASHVQPLGPACVRFSLRWKADSIDVLHGLADRHERARAVSFLLYYSIISGRSGAMGVVLRMACLPFLSILFDEICFTF